MGIKCFFFLFLTYFDLQEKIRLGLKKEGFNFRFRLWSTKIYLMRKYSSWRRTPGINRRTTQIWQKSKRNWRNSCMKQLLCIYSICWVYYIPYTPCAFLNAFFLTRCLFLTVFFTFCFCAFFFNKIFSRNHYF